MLRFSRAHDRPCLQRVDRHQPDRCKARRDSFHARGEPGPGEHFRTFLRRTVAGSEGSPTTVCQDFVVFGVGIMWAIVDSAASTRTKDFYNLLLKPMWYDKEAGVLQLVIICQSNQNVFRRGEHEESESANCHADRSGYAGHRGTGSKWGFRRIIKLLFSREATENNSKGKPRGPLHSVQNRRKMPSLKFGVHQQHVPCCVVYAEEFQTVIKRIYTLIFSHAFETRRTSTPSTKRDLFTRKSESSIKVTLRGAYYPENDYRSTYGRTRQV